MPWLASLAFIVTEGHSLPISDPNYCLLNGGTLVPGIPNFVLYCLVLLVVLEFVLKRVVAGRWIYAVGSSSRAARLLGVPVHTVRFSVYVVSGLLAAFASVLSVSYISNAEGTAGSAMMLQAIAAVVIGGASLFGGTGSAFGAMLGALMITVIQNGVNLIGINSFWQGSVTGFVILDCRVDRPRQQGSAVSDIVFAKREENNVTRIFNPASVGRLAAAICLLAGLAGSAAAPQPASAADAKYTVAVISRRRSTFPTGNGSPMA